MAIIGKSLCTVQDASVGGVVLGKEIHKLDRPEVLTCWLMAALYLYFAVLVAQSILEDSPAFRLNFNGQQKANSPRFVARNLW